MEVLLNTDKNIEGHERLENYVDSLVNEKLSRFNEHLTRIEIHLSDENGDKDTPGDKKCVLEARPKHKQPIVVTSHDDNIEKALNTAISKMRTALDSRLNK